MTSPGSRESTPRATNSRIASGWVEVGWQRRVLVRVPLSPARSDSWRNSSSRKSGLPSFVGRS